MGRARRERGEKWRSAVGKRMNMPVLMGWVEEGVVGEDRVRAEAMLRRMRKPLNRTRIVSCSAASNSGVSASSVSTPQRGKCIGDGGESEGRRRGRVGFEECVDFRLDAGISSRGWREM